MEEKNGSTLMEISRALFKSGIFPEVKNEWGAFAIVQYGMELGIGPMTSLQSMSFVRGKVCMAAQMMLSIAMQKGVTFTINVHTSESCEILFKNKKLEFLSSFTIAEAKQAGIWKTQGGWDRFPQDMLFWRTVTRGLRRVCPDAILGLYAREELEDAPSLKVEPTTNQKEALSSNSSLISGLITGLTQTEGVKQDGSKFKKYSVSIGGKKYSTFSATIAKTASEAKKSGQTVDIVFKTTTYGLEIESLVAQKPKEEALQIPADDIAGEEAIQVPANDIAGEEVVQVPLNDIAQNTDDPWDEALEKSGLESIDRPPMSINEYRSKIDSFCDPYDLNTWFRKSKPEVPSPIMPEVAKMVNDKIKNLKK